MFLVIGLSLWIFLPSEKLGLETARALPDYRDHSNENDSERVENL